MMPLNERGSRTITRMLQTRVVRAFFKLVIGAADDVADIETLRRQHKATKGRILRLKVGEIETDFRLGKNGIEEMGLTNAKPNATVVIDSPECIMAFLNGTISVPQQDGSFQSEVYDLQSMWWRGELRVIADPNEGWWSDMTALDSVLKDILPKLRARMGLR